MKSLLVAQLLALSITIVSPCVRTVPGGPNPACGTCTADQVTIGATDANTGAHAFDPAAPTPGVDGNGCSTLLYSCSGTSANIEVNSPDLTVGNANSGVQQVTTVLLVCNANNRWQYTGNENVVTDPVNMLTCLSVD